jgi:hypothetical protein
MGMTGLDDAAPLLELLIYFRIDRPERCLVHPVGDLLDDQLRNFLRQSCLIGGWLFRRP